MDSPSPQEGDSGEVDGRDERAGIYLAALAAFTVPILIVAAVMLTMTNEPEVVESLEPATRSGLDKLEIEAAELSIDDQPTTRNEEADDQPTTPTSPGSNGDADEAAKTDPSTVDASLEELNIAAGSLALAVYNQDADEPGTYSFAIRLTSLSTATEIRTDQFELAVVDEAGDSVPSLSRFEHDTLPVNSSALALVRAEEISPGPHFVVVSVGGVEIVRAAIDAPSS